MSSISVIAPVVILLVLAALAALIYLIVYRKRINRALQKGEDGDSAGPEPGSVNRTALIVALILIMAVMLLRIAGLSATVKEMNNALTRQSNTLSDLQLQMGDLTRTIKDQNSLISSYRLDFGRYDPAAHSAEITFTVVPKEITADMKLTLMVDKRRLELEREPNNPGAFTKTVSVDIFTAFTGDPLLLVVSDADVTRTEELEEYELTDLWLHYLPQIMVSGGGSLDYKNGTLTTDWDIQLDFFSKTDTASFLKEKITMRIESGGELLRETDLSDQIRWNGDWGRYSLTLKEKFAVTPGLGLKITVMAVDTMGNTHKAVVLETVEDRVIYTAGSGNYQVFDPDGRLMNP